MQSALLALSCSPYSMVQMMGIKRLRKSYPVRCRTHRRPYAATSAREYQAPRHNKHNIQTLDAQTGEPSPSCSRGATGNPAISYIACGPRNRCPRNEIIRCCAPGIAVGYGARKEAGLPLASQDGPDTTGCLIHTDSAAPRGGSPLVLRRLLSLAGLTDVIVGVILLAVPGNLVKRSWSVWCPI